MSSTPEKLRPTFVLVLTLAATAAAGWGSWVAMQTRIEARFDDAAIELADRVRARVATDVAVLRGTAAFATLARERDQLSFTRYVAALDLPRLHPGLGAVTFVEGGDAPVCAAGGPTLAAAADAIDVHVPLYADAGGALTIARTPRCAGMVGGRIATRAAFAPIVEEADLPRGVAVRIRDGQRLLYASGVPRDDEFRAGRRVVLGGIDWVVEVIGPASYASPFERWFAAGVVALGVLVALVVHGVMRGQLAALRRAEESRADLETLDRTGRALATELDPARLAERVVEAATVVTGATTSAVRVGGERAAGPPLDARRWPSRASATVTRADRGDLTLEVVADRAGAFDERERRLLAGIATHAAVALDNATLYARSQALVAELERGNRALTRSNRELDEFAYAASHDLRAPLRSIANLADWLEEDLGDRLDATAHAHLDRMRGRVQRLERMVDALLRFARAGRDLVHVEIDSARVFEQVVRELAPPPSARVVCEARLPALRGDPRALHEVLRQLIGNALVHAGREDVTVRVAAREVADGWELVVADDGRGIPEALHGRIWEMFETIEPRDRVDSSGLGLALVRKLVEASGGRTWVTSPPVGGVAFHLTWPS